MIQRSRASRFIVYARPEFMQFRTIQEKMWYETPEEIEDGLRWGEEKAALLKWVRRQMGRRLTKRERRCIELYFFEGLTFREVGDRTGTNASSAYRAIGRAIRKLHKAAAKGEGNLAKAMPKGRRFRATD
ncbi:MAG: sigma-70 family RNA polymerase sigma factor [Candidatus Hydrogenedentes bacterium]|nr:sigma-70 family RNA polymerase sigma factor [Candidatus Hydrogenedentota bacterium]